MKEKQKRNGNGIKILTIILVIILISMVGFIGIYTQKQNRMENIMKGYDLAMDLKGARVVSIKPKEDKKTVIKDSEGKVIEEDLTDEEIQTKGYTKEEIDNNVDKLTKENFEKTKELLDKRLQQMGLQNYIIKVNEETGEITIELEENSQTDEIVSNFGTTGKFEIVDSETEEVLMNNNDIKSVDVKYGSESSGTSVYMDIVFNKEGKKKLEEISTTYKTIENTTNNTTAENTATNDTETDTNQSTENTENTTNTTEAQNTQKKITMKIDGEEIMTTSFDTVIKTGSLQLTVGKTSTSTDIVNGYLKKAQRMATVLENGELPIEYEVSGNEYIESDIETSQVQKVILAFAIVVAILLIVLIIRYKATGLLTAISYIGLVAIYLILIRYTNVTISLEGIFGIGIVLLLNYLFINRILANINKKENDEIIKKTVQKTYGSFFLKIIPICIMAVTFCFMDWMPIASFGMVMFWGILLIAVYNFVITLPLLKMKENKE